MTPYKDDIMPGCIIREFDENVNEESLVWHRDEYSRTVIVMEGEGWRLQLDNKRPMDISKGSVVQIPSNEFHRLWKGNTPLKLKILELNRKVAQTKLINRKRTSVLEF